MNIWDHFIITISLACQRNFNECFFSQKTYYKMKWYYLITVIDFVYNNFNLTVTHWFVWLTLLIFYLFIIIWLSNSISEAWNWLSQLKQLKHIFIVNYCIQILLNVFTEKLVYFVFQTKCSCLSLCTLQKVVFKKCHH